MPQGKSAADIFKDIENAPTGSAKKLRRFKKAKASKKKASKKKASKQVEKSPEREIFEQKELEVAVQEVVNRSSELTTEQKEKASKMTPQDVADLDRSIPSTKKKSGKKFKLDPAIKKQIKKITKKKK